MRLDPAQVRFGDGIRHRGGAVGIGAGGPHRVRDELAHPGRGTQRGSLRLLFRDRREHAAHIVRMHVLARLDVARRDADRKAVAMHRLAHGNVMQGKLVTERDVLPGSQFPHGFACCAERDLDRTARRHRVERGRDVVVACEQNGADRT